MDDFRQDCEDWWWEFKQDSRGEHFDYPQYPETQPDPSNFDLDIPF